MAAKPPGGVVLIAIVAWIASVLQLVAGSLALSGVISTEVSPPAAWVAIIIGTVTFLVAFALFGGSQMARVFVTISFVLSLLSAVLSIIAHPFHLVSPVISGFLALVGLILLYTGRSNDYFRR